VKPDVTSPNALLFDNPIDLAIVMTNLPFHRTHQPEEPHNSVELEAMKLKVVLIRLIVIGVGVYFGSSGFRVISSANL
jgi:hypothetical protein